MPGPTDSVEMDTIEWRDPPATPLRPSGIEQLGKPGPEPASVRRRPRVPWAAYAVAFNGALLAGMALAALLLGGR